MPPANRYGAFGEIGENPTHLCDAEQKVPCDRKGASSDEHSYLHAQCLWHGAQRPQRGGLHQLDVLNRLIKPQHVVIGHMPPDDPEADIIRQITARGVRVDSTDEYRRGTVPDENA